MLEKNVTQLSLIACSLFFSPLTYGSVETSDDPIMVSADRIKSPLETSPSDIKVFYKEEIEKSSSIVELLNKESDLKLVQSGPSGSNTSLFLRGSDSSHTLVIIDGIIMNDPSNPNRQFDIGRLSLNNVEKIEILKGSQGLLYGSNAIGGVMLITTKFGKEKASGSALVDYGAFNTINAAVNAQQKFNNTAVSVGVDHLKTRGFSAANISKNPNADDDGEKRTTLSSSVVQTINPNNNLSFNYRGVFDEVDLDKGGGAGNDDPNDSQFTEQHFMKAAWNHLWSSAETQFSYAKSIHHRSLNVRPDAVHTQSSSTTTRGVLGTVSINHTQYTNDFLTQNINLDYQHEEDQLKNKNENLSAFLYNRFAFGPAIINFGARLDSNKYFDEHVTYKIALMHFFSRFTLKMSYSTGFRAPSLNQLFDPTYGNKNLKPEESQTAEVGFDVPVGDKLKYVGTFFYTDLKNRLSYDPNTFVNQNRGRAKIVGWENNFHIDISEEFKNHTTLTWMSARDTTARIKLPRRPNLNIKSSIEYVKNNHSAEVSGDFTGRRADVDNLGNAVDMPSYLILNLSYNYRVTQNFSTYAKLHNLLDKDYEEVFGYGTGGRAATVGLKYDF